jgi:hypothetical protein
VFVPLIAVPANVFSLENLSKILTTKNKKEYFVKTPLFIQTKICQTSEEKKILGKLFAHFDTISIFGAFLCQFSTILKDFNFYVANYC